MLVFTWPHYTCRPCGSQAAILLPCSAASNSLDTSRLKLTTTQRSWPSRCKPCRRKYDMVGGWFDESDLRDSEREAEAGNGGTSSLRRTGRGWFKSTHSSSLEGPSSPGSVLALEVSLQSAFVPRRTSYSGYAPISVRERAQGVSRSCDSWPTFHSNILVWTESLIPRVSNPHGPAMTASAWYVRSSSCFAAVVVSEPVAAIQASSCSSKQAGNRHAG